MKRFFDFFLRRAAFRILITAFVVSLACLFLAMAKTCQSAPLTFRDRLIAVQPGISTKKNTPVDPEAMADALLKVKGLNGQWAALMLAVAANESALDDNIRRGQCKDYECDSYKGKDGTIQHRAWGLWQLHKNLTNDSDWGSEDLGVQARAASRMLRGAFYQCQKSGVAFPLGAIRAFAGHGCDVPLKGEEKRMAIYNRLLGRL